MNEDRMCRRLILHLCYCNVKYSRYCTLLQYSRYRAALVLYYVSFRVLVSGRCSSFCCQVLYTFCFSILMHFLLQFVSLLLQLNHKHRYVRKLPSFFVPPLCAIILSHIMLFLLPFSRGCIRTSVRCADSTALLRCIFLMK